MAVAIVRQRGGYSCRRKEKAHGLMPWASSFVCVGIAQAAAFHFRQP